MTSAKIIADSVGPSGKRLTTYVACFPRFILAQLNKHRALSSNTASSRAIPTRRMIGAVIHAPYVPPRLGRNRPGMQSASDLPGWKAWICRQLWLGFRWPAILVVHLLDKLGLHKQWANRLLEPWLYVVAIISGTEWDNFFCLRHHREAQPEFYELTCRMLEALRESTPKELKDGEWHLPYGDRYIDEGLTNYELLQIVVARCARVSYQNFEGDIDHEKDYELYRRLLGEFHMSAFEHAAQALPFATPSGNFVGFQQYRKMITGENRIGFDYESR